MSNTSQELAYIKNDYKRTGNAEQNNSQPKTNTFKTMLIYILKLLLKLIYWGLVGFFQVCIAIFMIMLFAPLYMFFGVKPNIKRNWRI